MQIQFDLNDSKLFIPNGRLMNLKDKLGWTDIKISESEIKDICFGIETMSFDGAISFNYENKIKQFMSNDTIKVQRIMAYNELPKDLTFNRSQIDMLNIKIDSEITEVLEDTEEFLNDEKIKNKLLKLNQLRQINGE